MRVTTGVLAAGLAAVSLSFVGPGPQGRRQDPGPAERTPDGPDRAAPASAPIHRADRTDRGEGPDPGSITAFQVTPRFDHAFTLEEIAALLAHLTAQYPDLATLGSIGQSGAGREIPMLTITDPAGGAADGKPALLVVDFRVTGYGAEACLATATRILERARAEPEIAQLLADHTIYLAPALAPDAS